MEGLGLSTPSEVEPTAGYFGAHLDFRGSWTRAADQEIFRAVGQEIQQVSISISPEVGTWRGLHSLSIEAGEWKLVTCVSGRILDYAVDLRPGSKTPHKVHEFELSFRHGDYVLIPPGFAHGFYTLEANTVLSYTMSCDYDSTLEENYSVFDPSFGIELPGPIQYISEKDKNAKWFGR